jgi:hypothetical protein
MTCSHENSVKGQSLERNLGCFQTMNCTTIQLARDIRFDQEQRVLSAGAAESLFKG